jgi:transcriptional regulator with GAF, ATPase, and Fis domain
MKETRLDVIDQLFDVAEGLLTPGKLVQKMLSIFIHFSRSERGAVLLLDEQNSWELYALAGMTPNNFNTVRDICNSYLGEPGRNPSMVYIADTRKDEKFRKISVLKSSDILSFLCLPLRLENRVYGVLYLDSTSSSSLFSTPDLERLSRYSRLITSALIGERKLGDSPVSIATITVDDYLAERSIDELEKQQLHALLEKNNWNVTRTAQTLGMPRRTLYNKMSKHNILRPRRNKRAAAMAATL